MGGLVRSALGFPSGARLAAGIAPDLESWLVSLSHQLSRRCLPNFATSKIRTRTNVVLYMYHSILVNGSLCCGIGVVLLQRSKQPLPLLGELIHGTRTILLPNTPVNRFPKYF